MGETEAVLAANAAFYAAFTARDLTAMQRVWSRTLPITCIHPGWDALNGWQAVMDSWTAILGNNAAPRIRVRGARAQLFGGAALVVCYELLPEAILIATNGFVQESGDWRMVHHQAGPTAALPALEPEPEQGPSRLH
jgi:hypothetical protein